MQQLVKKAIHGLLLLLVILMVWLPYSGFSGSHKIGGQVYEWQLARGKLVLYSYPAAPSEGKYIIIDKTANTLYFYDNRRLIKRYPVATGKDPTFTPEGKFTIAQKAILIPEGENSYSLTPDEPNPRLGSRWIGLDIPPQADKRQPNSDSRAPAGLKYGIHGTDDPSSIGKHISGGCVRMHDHHVQELYEQVEVGTVVEIRS